ncbi:hypothetical protein F5Y00DRAFT_270 [Daldinia vernicosa]|uniref:uncharacterized protein n=1 Tax=Daldinia vernicosa TaxID=114800 RepID=UPI002008A36A|nr:uncharacterized protein F5Y00DRAFT_270 [Daldinia vernicosa]KAI0854060.1 hypothetical protein F5Y00DRAFT_270 [Daldinia vernicosa]
MWCRRLCRARSAQRALGARTFARGSMLASSWGTIEEESASTWVRGLKYLALVYLRGLESLLTLLGLLIVLEGSDLLIRTEESSRLQMLRQSRSLGNGGSSRGSHSCELDYVSNFRFLYLHITAKKPEQIDQLLGTATLSKYTRPHRAGTDVLARTVSRNLSTVPIGSLISSCIP